LDGDRHAGLDRRERLRRRHIGLSGGTCLDASTYFRRGVRVNLSLRRDRSWESSADFGPRPNKTPIKFNIVTLRFRRMC
jgi:hypothetical protein